MARDDRGSRFTIFISVFPGISRYIARAARRPSAINFVFHSATRAPGEEQAPSERPYARYSHDSTCGVTGHTVIVHKGCPADEPDCETAGTRIGCCVLE